MNIRAALTGTAAALCLLSAGPARAVRPITPPAPEFPPGAAWVNSSAFSLKQLQGKRVVMLTFLNTLTINSVRTFADINRLWRRYNLEGLMVIGVHTPDFDFDRDPIAVREIIKSQDIRFPVVIDSERKIWNAYRNEGWPGHYLIDHKSRIIHDRLGEGGFVEFEEEILLALKKFRGYKPPKNYSVPEPEPRKECGQKTGSFYLGERRGGKLKQIQPKKYLALGESRDGEVAVYGRWATEEDAVRSKEGNDGVKFTTRLRLIYRGAESMAVLTRVTDKPVKLYVKQGDLWLHSGNGHKDVKWDDDDRSYVLVDQPRLYWITRNSKKGMQELVFYPESDGIGIASFEFSDACQAESGKTQ